jgi:coenzyme PQQ biosynthesis protein PqqD
MISAESRPRVAAKARLRFDPQAQQYLLLYPEMGLALNPTAAEILKLCTGEHTVEAIVERLVATHPAESRQAIEGQVLAFLQTMADRGLVKDGP